MATSRLARPQCFSGVKLNTPPTPGYSRIDVSRPARTFSLSALAAFAIAVVTMPIPSHAWPP